MIKTSFKKFNLNRKSNVMRCPNIKCDSKMRTRFFDVNELYDYVLHFNVNAPVESSTYFVVDELS